MARILDEHQRGQLGVDGEEGEEGGLLLLLHLGERRDLRERRRGGDTAFLCGITAPEGKVVGFDVQEAAIASTRKHLEQLGVPAARYELHCQSHADLLQVVQPGTADAVMFNFGWLPGADHAVFSTASSSIPALQAALEAVRPGGVVSAILYSGQVIGTDEKQTVLEYLRALPLKSFTVLVCDFANWAETAPLPCLILKK